MLTREVILSALSRLSDRLREMNVVGEINIVGGTAMMLAFQVRQTTKDIDAIFAPVDAVREAAGFVPGDLDFLPDWLNDAVKGFAPARGGFGVAEGIGLSTLRFQTPIPE